MNKEDTLALYEQGKDAWNAWAEELLTQRRTWMENGVWPEGEPTPDGNTSIAAWCTTATADFNNHRFEEDVRFSGFIFPWVARFDGSQFHQEAWFDGVCFHQDVRFDGSQFHRISHFDGVRFRQVVLFYGAEFQQCARFDLARFNHMAGFHKVRFNQEATFLRAEFHQTAIFGGVYFQQLASFGNAHFHEDVTFGGARFLQDAWFGETRFHQEAGFRTTTFAGSVFFESAQFRGDADFLAAKSDRAFSLEGSVFETVPEFSQMSFSEAPRLDNLRLQPRGFARLRRLYDGLRDTPRSLTHTAVWIAARWRKWRGRATDEDEEVLSRIAPNDLAARYRALQRLAERGHNYRLEQQFFRAELRAHQFAEDWPWHPRFWFTVVYEILSNFGSSMVLPAFWLIVSLFLFAAAYLSLSATQPPSYWDSLQSIPQQAAHKIVAKTGLPFPISAPAARKCENGGAGDPYTAALALSGRNTLLFAAGAWSDANRNVQTCLFGFHKVAERYEPKAPSMVTVFSAVQIVVSLILIFLFGLALRNNFKIK